MFLFFFSKCFLHVSWFFFFSIFLVLGAGCARARCALARVCSWLGVLPAHNPVFFDHPLGVFSEPLDNMTPERQHAALWVRCFASTRRPKEKANQWHFCWPFR